VPHISSSYAGSCFEIDALGFAPCRDNLQHLSHGTASSLTPRPSASGSHVDSLPLVFSERRCQAGPRQIRPLIYDGETAVFGGELKHLP
jgi:hypothetical protein